jgi:arylsulfatase A-like enzyme
MKTKTLACFSFVCMLLTFVSAFAQNTNPARPNLLIIDADDMGFGDVKVFSDIFGTANKIPTPRMDTLAAQGRIFTQMHACSALCSPSRYGILTGRYSWRLKSDGVLPSGVVGAYGQPIIRQGEMTIAQFLKNQGYDTAAFGKWHLGAQWYNQQGVPYTGNSQSIADPSKIDLVRRVEGHAIDQGFNHFYGLAATINEPPYVAVVDDHVYYDGAPATTNSPWLKILGSSLTGGSAAPNGVGDPNFTNNSYIVSQMQCGPDMITNAVKYLTARGTNSQPFFAYVALYSPHLPLMVLPQFVGSSGINNFPYGDYIHQSDYWIGQVLDALGANSNNTIVIVTSDNGPENAMFVQALNKGHDSNGPFRGIKRDSWEGGHRIPFIIRWPGKVAPGTVSSNLLWQGDIYATMADYLGVTIPSGQAPDSVSFLSTLLNPSVPSTNQTPLVLASSENQLSLSTADGWKLIDGTGSGGFDTTYDADNNTLTNAHGTIGGTPKQLFALPRDIGERNNVQASHTYKVNELMSLLNFYRDTPSSIAPLPDTDGDGIPDYWEQLYGLNPNNPNDATNHPPADNQLTYLQKYLYGLNPLTNDTDGDGLSDFAELFIYGTDPLNPDTDGDGVSDGQEIAAFSNPRNPASVVAISDSTVTQLLPAQIQMAGVNGTLNNPAVYGGTNWPASGALFVRERGASGSDQEWRTRLFVKFNLAGITNTFANARLRLYQTDRLNSFTASQYSAALELARVTASWGTNAGSFPLFSNTPVADAFYFGRNDDFGTSETAQGFYSGTPGVPGTNDSGFDPGGQVSAIVGQWLNGTTPNYGFRIRLDQSFTGAAFSPTDNPATPLNEQFALLVTTHNSITNLDSNHNGMLDSQELQLFGNLDETATSDDDNDGVPDRVELALGSNPKDANSRPEFNLRIGTDGHLLLTFQRSLISGVGYEIQVSPDLQQWTSAMESFTLVSTQDLGNGYERATFTAKPQGSTLFVRLNLIFPSAQ